VNEPEVQPGDVRREGKRGVAIFNAEGNRRRWLARRLSDSPKRVGFVMLNPSQADADDNDNTITRCVGFALREGGGVLEVANLADIIETDSKKLTGLAHLGAATDGNSRHYLRHVLGCDLVIAAWGAHRWARGRLANYGAPISTIGFQCLGVTKAGAPNHPLYLAASTPLRSWP
jgi:hypothetical protein